jgi:uncharacterized protein YndB with AHSA1/START domain
MLYWLCLLHTYHEGDGIMLGTLHSMDDGRLALRFERRFAHPPEKVWRAITEFDQLRAWFPAVVQFDLRPGAKLSFDLTPEAKRRFGLDAGQPTTTHGEITRVEPPNLLEYTWGDEILRWELEADGAGGCDLVFTDIFDGTGGVVESGAVNMGAGWHAGLEVLEAHLDGREIDWSAWDRAAELGRDYARSLAQS